MTLTTAPFAFTPEIGLELWYLAAQAELGIAIPVLEEKPIGIQARLYEIRKDINDPRLANLSSCISADSTTIFIFKQGVTLE